MKTLKNLVDFTDIYLDKNFNYHIYGLKEKVNKGDTLILDLAIFKDSHTLIKAKVNKNI